MYLCSSDIGIQIRMERIGFEVCSAPLEPKIDRSDPNPCRQPFILIRFNIEYILKQVFVELW